MSDESCDSGTHTQRPCIHCGDCARACPEALDPEALFFALVEDDWPTARARRLEACTECNRCTLACPSHIPLLDWLRWGKPEVHVHASAEAARNRFLARKARLARGRDAGAARRRDAGSSPQSAASPARTISREEVLAAVARGRKKQVRSSS